MSFLDKNSRLNLPEAESRVLKFWEEHHIFDKAVKVREAAQKPFVFYEGPPTANGRPGIHHVITRAFKDVVLRFRTMRGDYVPRNAGWDTHGLPVELEVEKKLGLNSKTEIEQYGIAKFNQKCKESVWEYKDEWERMTERMGYWLDMDHAYVTYEPQYMESLWWTISQFYKNNLLFEGHTVVPWCTRCGTSLSSHELAQGYETVEDTAVYVKFEAKGEDNTYLLSWTTTPWTLPGNVALAINPDLAYVRAEVEHEGKKEQFIFARDLQESLEEIFSDVGYSLEGVEAVGMEELEKLEYKPLFDIPDLQNKKSHRVYPADFVTADEGTGIVHTAVMYGQEDYELGKELGLPQVHTVNEEGRFTDKVPGLNNMPVKSTKTEGEIFNILEQNNSVLYTHKARHEYPHCWRCDTPLLYYARAAWFVGMSKLRKQLQENNSAINWIPSHLKEGRFGEWLKEAKDWNFSRERYWGTPLPVWRCESCESVEVIGSVSELAEKLPQSGNEYILLRHGEAESNTKNIVDSDPASSTSELTEKGKKQASAVAKELQKEGIDIVISSDFPRAQKTAEAVAKELGVEVQTNQALREVNTGDFHGRPTEEYHTYFSGMREKLFKRPPGGENLRDLAARLRTLFEDLEEKYRDKKILLVFHEYPIWIAEALLRGWGEEQLIQEKFDRGDDFIANAEFRKLSPLPFTLPRNEWGFVDLHRPYVDDIMWSCKCAGEMQRVPEVADVWFDSGAMPFASQHFPFVGSGDGAPENYPADFICEAIDQTRGWFYTLLAVATALGQPAPYKNVISLGHVMDKHGKKMSKSRGNTVDPWKMMDTHGIDAVRWFFYIASPSGEPSNFDEDEVKKRARKFHNILYNSAKFYATYLDKSAAQNIQKKPNPEHVLDRWILARLKVAKGLMVGHMNSYHVRQAAVVLEELVDDLSRWYIRRSRARMQEDPMVTHVLGYVLLETIKLTAPFCPFFAEGLYEMVTHGVPEPNKKESVHLEDIAEMDEPTEDEQKLIQDMVEVRRIASDALAKRAEKGIKVRQPLAALQLPKNQARFAKTHEFADILMEEVNVKWVDVEDSIEEVALDTELTGELKLEGALRELARKVQGLRRKAGLNPNDTIALMLDIGGLPGKAAKQYEDELKGEVGAEMVHYGKSEKFDAEFEGGLEGEDAWIGLRKL